MLFHGTVRALMYRLAATMLVALLAGGSLATCPSGLADERDRSSPQDTGISAPPGPKASATLSVAPLAPAASLSSTARVVLAVYARAGGSPQGKPPRLGRAFRSAPTILRV